MLKDCRCGSDLLAEVEAIGLFWIVCAACGHRGKKCLVVEDCIAEWNTREPNLENPSKSLDTASTV